MILSKGRLIDKVVRRGRLKSNKASLFTGSSIMQSNGLILLCPGSFLVITSLLVQYYWVNSISIVTFFSY